MKTTASSRIVGGQAVLTATFGAVIEKPAPVLKLLANLLQHLCQPWTLLLQQQAALSSGGRFEGGQTLLNKHAS